MALTHLRSATADKRPSPGVMSDGQIAINTNTGSPGLFFKDSNGSLVKVGPVHIGSTAPNSSPAVGGQTGNSKGEIWLDNSAGGFVVKIWDGTAWRSESGQFVDAAGDTMTGALVMDNQQQVRFREASANGTNFIGLQAPASVASDKTITLPDVTGTVVTTGDTGTVTSAMIVDGTITNADINASAAIADTKLATISTANKVSASALDIDGATDIGAALADADLILVDDGGAGTNRKAAITRVTDYTFGKVSGDITITSAGAASLPSTGTAGTYTKVTTDAKGRVTSGTTLSVSDVPTLTSAKISDFDTQVRTSRLDQMAAPTGALSANNQKITNLATPTADSDAANKGYVDAVKQSLDIKDSVRVATTANITLSGLQTIDGVSVAANDRVLVKDQTTASANGIYVASSSAWTRSTDTDTSAKVTAGLFVFVTEGSTNADSGWVLTTNDTITLGTTSLSFSQFSGAGQITDGAGLTKTGNTINVGTASSARIVVNADNIDLATSGVTAGTYRSVTTDTYGRITAGTNPTTLSGYGITDAATSTHTHGNITNAGAIGTTANLPVITTTSGVLTTGTFGTAANTFCQGNDSRLSDTRNTTNTVTFNNAGSGGASGSTFNGGSALTVSYNTVGAPSTTGTNASGTWGISITGDAASVDGKSFGTFSAAGGILYATSTTAASAIGAGAAGQLLKSGVSGAPTWATLEMTDVPGATYKKSVRVATTAALTATLSGNVLTNSGTLAALAIDGVTLVANDRILVKDQATGAHNGIYYVSNVGSASVAWTLTRDADADANTEIGSGIVAVDTGTTNGGRLYTTTFKATDTLNTTSMPWYEILYNSGTWAISTTGNAATATTLATARTINGVSFNGSANISVNTNNTVTFNNGGAGAASGTTFNGGSAVTVSYNTVGAAASSHTHGNITNAGAIGSTANLPVITTTSGVLTTGSFGTAANTFCQGNDSRLSDTRNTTNLITFNNGGSGGASGSTFNGGSALTVSYNSVGAPSTTGTNASGTWGINITGDAASVDGKSFGTFSAAGGILYATSTTDASATAAGTSGQFLKSAGASAPVWDTLEMDDIPGATYKKSVRVATTEALTASFASNVLTNTGTLAALSIDGLALAVNDRVLVKDQTSALQNGIYYVSNIGSASVAWTLTRAADADSSSEIAAAIVGIDRGSTHGGELWTTTFRESSTFNSTSINWYEVVYNTGTWDISVTGNASSATQLATPRTINGVSFNGSANISVNTNNTVTFNNAGSGGASGATFNGGSALTVSYNTVGAPSTTGTGASGTWGISVTGSAGSAGTAANLSAGALGSIPYQSATATTAMLPAGTSGQFLKSAGAAAPVWDTLEMDDIPGASYKKSVRVATTGDLGASKLVSNVLHGYPSTFTSTASTTSGSTTLTLSTVQEIKPGAVISGNPNIPAGTTVASISAGGTGTTLTMSAAATATASSVSTTFTQTIAAFPSIDGVALSVNDRILVKDSTTLGGRTNNTPALINGIYTVTSLGSTSAAWQLTRSADADSTSEIAASIVNVDSGTTNGGRLYTTSFKITDTLNTTAMAWGRVVDESSDRYLRLPSDSLGIQFGGDTAAANALNDYEEGTWTPVVDSTGTGWLNAATYTSRSGSYRKIGNMVVVQFSVNVNTVTPHTTGPAQIGGLPFTAAASTFYGEMTLGDATNIPENVNVVPVILSSQTRISLYHKTTTGVIGTDGNDFGSTPSFSGTITYFTA